MPTRVRINDLPFVEARNLSLLYLTPEKVPAEQRDKMRRSVLDCIFPPRCIGINPNFWQTELGIAAAALAWQEWGKTAIIFRHEESLVRKLVKPKVLSSSALAVAAEFLTIFQAHLVGRGTVRYVRREDVESFAASALRAEFEELARVSKKRRTRKVRRESRLLKFAEYLADELSRDDSHSSE